MTNTEIIRSPLLLSASNSAMLIVDAQERLLPVVPGHERVVWNIRRLIDGAKLLGVPIVVSEQYPEKLGATAEVLRERLQGQAMAKTSFSCCGSEEVNARLSEIDARQVLVVGIETHVCVLQTVFDLMSNGYQVHVAVDATAARHEVDVTTGIQRMDSAGATITTVEAALFEWCEVSGTPEFKKVSALVRETLDSSSS